VGSAVFWDTTRCRVVIVYRRFGKTYRSRNVGKQLTHDAAQYRRRAQISKLLWIIRVDFDITDQLLIRYSSFLKYLTKMAILMDFKTACGSHRRGDWYNVLFGFGVSMRVIRLIKMCLTKLLYKSNRQVFV
jgi:hypothetical protein